MSSESDQIRSDKRFPSANFTRKLERICAAIDAQDVAQVASKVVGIEVVSHARVAKLWVAGTYARGAQMCGDLDLVLELECIEGGLPQARALAQKLVGTLRFVSYYGGTPEKNSSGVAFPEAVEIWSGPHSPWKERLASISENPDAGPAARAADILPVRPAQLGCTYERLEEVIALLTKGILTSEFVPFKLPLQEEEINEGLLGSRRAASRATALGRKSRQLVPAVVALLRDREPEGRWRAVRWGNAKEFWCGASRVVLGASKLPIHELLQGVQCAQIVIAPHFSVRGPNGAWLLRRGPAHPDVAQIAELKAWYLTSARRPSLAMDMDSGALVLELFTSKHEANKFKHDELEVSLAAGEEVLRLCAMADALDLNGDVWIPVRPSGYTYAGERTVTVADMKIGLEEATQAQRRQKLA